MNNNNYNCTASSQTSSTSVRQGSSLGAFIMRKRTNANGTLRRQDTSDPRAPSGVRFVQDTPAVKLNSNQFGKDDPTSNGYATSSTLSASASDNSASLLTIPFPWISLGCLLGPLFAFGYCIVYSFFYHYEWTTQTHCNVWNFAPSISASIGLFRPQKYVWKLFVSLHSAPRLLFALMYRSYFMKGLGSKYRIHAEVSFVCYIFEVLSLLMLSFAPSREDFKLHKNSFAVFLVVSALYMLLTFWLLHFKWLKPRRPWEETGHRLKKLMVQANMGCILVCLYLYYRHNRYCEPGIYSIFSIFEYGVVLTNMGYHWTSYYDFYDKTLQI